MARTKKVLEEIKSIELSKEEKAEDRDKIVKKFVKLVVEVKNGKNKERADEAFNEIIELMKSKIMYLAYTIHIPGHRIEDIYQEALFALRYKAIKDYDKKRSLKKDISPFDTFALLCIRRHLSTKLKASYQRKQRALNYSISLDQDRSAKGADNSIVLSEIVPSLDLDEFSKIKNKDTFSRLVKSLWDKMSYLEKKVFILYKQGLSYEEIRKNMNKGKRKDKINTKSIDNALMRLKQKATEIYKQFYKEK